MATAPNTDRKLLLITGAVALVLIVGIAVFAPSAADNDPTPSIHNASTNGLRALYLALERMGRRAELWQGTVEDLRNVDAAKTTAILAEPAYDEDDRKVLREGLERFLNRGGRVIVTGMRGAFLLPDGSAKDNSLLVRGLCHTEPGSAGALGAGAGEVQIFPQGQWSGTSKNSVPDQRCGPDIVVAHMSVGAGTGIWFASAMPMSNGGLKNDGDLRLTLSALGEGRDVLFLEELHSTGERSWFARHAGLLKFVACQLVALFILIVLSFSRRRGPRRDARQFPRSSPTEFAESMGALYSKAKATDAAVIAARERLRRLLRLRVGLAAETLRESSSIANALHARLGGDWTALSAHWTAADAARTETLTASDALKLVRALREDEHAVETALERPALAEVR